MGKRVIDGLWVTILEIDQLTKYQDKIFLQKLNKLAV
jgi:hypothetical protein